MSFALYKIGMAKYETKDKNNAVKQIEADKKELEEQAAKEEEEKKGKHVDVE